MRDSMDSFYETYVSTFLEDRTRPQGLRVVAADPRRRPPAGKG